MPWEKFYSRARRSAVAAEMGFVENEPVDPAGKESKLLQLLVVEKVVD